MKRQASQLSIILAAIVFAPAALAGSEILKCTDPAGHVTLTDQPCAGSDASVRLTAATPDEDVQVQEQPAAAPAPVVEHRLATPGLIRHTNWRNAPVPRSNPLARDVATLKEARVQMMLLDGASKALRQPRLAGLN